ncbi:MAG: hypothetical protein AAGI11_11340 [Pseudomonadota bacterium]
MQAGYVFEEGLGPMSRVEITAGIENFTDEEPQFIPGISFFDFSFNDIRQRTWYAALNMYF